MINVNNINSSIENYWMYLLFMYLFHIDFDGYIFSVTLFRQLGKICVYVKNDTKAFCDTVVDFNWPQFIRITNIARCNNSVNPLMS